MLEKDHFLELNDCFKNEMCLSYSAVLEVDGIDWDGSDVLAFFDGGGTVMPAFSARLGRRRFFNFVLILLLQDP